MPLYECTKCQAIENTALGDYWEAQLEQKPPVCSECGTGKWHGRFPKRTAAEAGYVRGTDGFFGPSTTTTRKED